MKFLLDTHTLLWWLSDNPTLTNEARNAIANGENLIFVSAVSAWEIAIKKAIGKLVAPDDLASAIVVNAFQSQKDGKPRFYLGQKSASCNDYDQA